MKKEPVVATFEARKRFGQTEALRGLNLSVDGGAVGLVGPNGAGKTTFLRAAMGLTRLDSGRISTFGMDPARKPLDVRSRVGFVPENDSYWEGLSGVGSVQYAGRLSGLSRKEALKRAHTLLDEAGLSEERYRPVENYSMGMRQKVRIAQALVGEPELLILDEPLRFLDPSARSEFKKWMSIRKGHGTTIIISSHEISEIDELCDRFLIMLNGILKADVSASELFKKGDKWELDLGGPNDLAIEILRRSGAEEIAAGDVITFRADDERSRRAIKELAKAGLRPRSVKKAPTDIDAIITSTLRKHSREIS